VQTRRTHELHSDSEPGFRELAFRANAGLEVALLWSASEDQLLVSVSDSCSGERFVLDADKQNALDVFYHPYVHATFQAAA
jgi:hypothetical protein